MADYGFRHSGKQLEAEQDEQTELIRRVTQLLNQSRPTLLIGMVVALVVYIGLSGWVAADYLRWWIIGVVAITALRIALLGYWRARVVSNPRWVVNSYAFSAFVAGITWAALVGTYDTHLPMHVQLFLLMMLTCVPVASLPTNAIHMSVFLAFNTPLFLSLFYWAWVEATELVIEFTVVALCYCILVMMIACKYSRNHQRSIVRDLENQALLAEVRQANSKLHELAYQDPLTSLSNRRQFQLDVEQALENLDCEKHQLALMMIDVDNFKDINDQLGHDAGDQVLIAIARRIQLTSRQTEMIAQSLARAARIGGDEFIMLYQMDAAAHGVHQLARRLLGTICEPMQINGHQVEPSVSLGVALAPQHARQTEQLLKLADRAMYQAKKSGGNRYMISSG